MYLDKHIDRCVCVRAIIKLIVFSPWVIVVGIEVEEVGSSFAHIFVSKEGKSMTTEIYD